MTLSRFFSNLSYILLVLLSRTIQGFQNNFCVAHLNLTCHAMPFLSLWETKKLLRTCIVLHNFINNGSICNDLILTVCQFSFHLLALAQVTISRFVLFKKKNKI